MTDVWMKFQTLTFVDGNTWTAINAEGLSVIDLSVLLCKCT